LIYIIIRHDRPGVDHLRDKLKSQHRAFLSSFGKALLTAGAIFDLDGRVIGGSITFEAADIDEARALSEKDPYAHSDIAVSTQIIPFRARWRDGIFYDGAGYSSKQESLSFAREDPKMKLTLYIDSHWISPYAFSAYIALKEKGLTFEVRELAFDKSEQLQNAYPEVSYTGRIPALVHEDFWLAESSAIVEYLDEKFPSPHYQALLPDSANQRALARMVMAFVRSDLLALREERPTTTMFYEKATTPLSEKGQRAAHKLVRFAERLIRPGHVSMFDKWSIADADLAFMLQRLHLNGHELPASLAAFVEMQWARPAVRSFVEHHRRPFTPYSY
jgi:glutathione S-transferase